jgi:hypothetical protein
MFPECRGTSPCRLFGRRARRQHLLQQPGFRQFASAPNQNLGAPYQKIDVSGAWAVHPRLRVYTSIENLLNQDYEASFGLPALPLTARVGFKLTVGGD